METKTKFKIIFAIFLALNIVVFIYLLINQGTVSILEPKGVIAFAQKQIIIQVMLIMMAVVIPVFGFAAYVIFKYRANQKPSSYEPNKTESPIVAVILWGVSITTVSIIGVVIWQSSHALDPYKKLESPVEPITIQVVALNWKWLFIYPKEGIATVNYIMFPKDTPITFKLTADAPMNTFWIPQLGGQTYAMAGMQNEINLMANEYGIYNGSATEINGKGYSGMKFKATAVSQADYQAWVKGVQESLQPLNKEVYKELAKESANNLSVDYSWVEPNLFDTIIMSYMMPQTENKDAVKLKQDIMEMH